MLSGLFNLDNPIFKFLSTLVDLVLLNVLFVISCIPIFTIGAALTSLQYVMVTGWDTQNSKLIKMYTRSFKQNFKQSTVVWLVMLVVGAFFAATGWMIYQQSKVDDSVIFMAIVIVFVLICLAYLCIFTYIWPMIAKFENTTLMMVVNSLVMAISHLPSTIIAWMIFGLGVYFMLTNMVVAAFGVLILCAVIAYFMGKVFQNVFAPYLKEIRHFDGEPLDYESPGVDLEHSYAEAKREVAEMAAENAEEGNAEDVDAVASEDEEAVEDEPCDADDNVEVAENADSQ